MKADSFQVNIKSRNRFMQQLFANARILPRINEFASFLNMWNYQSMYSTGFSGNVDAVVN